MTATSLRLISTSAATDAGWLAAADIAMIAETIGAQYRLVGGLAVTLLVHALGADGVAPHRETADADLGAPMDVCADRALVGQLRDVGYAQVQGNRFARTVGQRELVIDVLAPSYEGRLVSNQTKGELVVDEIPGLQTALMLEPTVVNVAAVLTDGTEVVTTLCLPDVTAALVMKAYAYRGRFGRNDAVDVHRLLEAANLAGRTGADWPDRVETREAAKLLHKFFDSPQLVHDLGEDAPKVRLLTRRVVPAPKR